MPYPNESMDTIWEICDLILPGNHDLAVYKYAEHIKGNGPDPLSWFNSYAAWAIKWTQKELSARNMARLEQLVKKDKFLVIQKHLVTKKHSQITQNIIFVHSEPTQPEEMQYIQCFDDAQRYFFSHKKFRYKICFVGHMHIPQLYVGQGDQSFEGGKIKFALFGGINRRDTRDSDMLSCFQPAQGLAFEKEIDLKKYCGALIVVPSVGQPRDRVNYAGYAIYDTMTGVLQMRRIPYDFVRTQKRMMNLDFPNHLIKRIKSGH